MEIMWTFSYLRIFFWTRGAEAQFGLRWSLPVEVDYTLKSKLKCGVILLFKCSSVFSP
jgi:hypothetical protein